MPEYYTGKSMVVTRLEIAGPSMGENVIRDTVHNAMSVAWKINAIVVIQMNGCDLYISPDDEDVDAKVDALKHAWAAGAKSIW